MQTIKSVDFTAATGKTKRILDGALKALGVVPNLMLALANSPAALNAYASFDGALIEGSLSGQTRELIAVAVANANSCDYCLSAHTALGRLAGLSDDDLDLAQKSEARDAKTAAALRFATKVVRARGHLPPSEVETLRAAGHTDSDITEIIAVVALNIFTNYFNHIAGTEIDFPAVRSVSACDPCAVEERA